LNSRFKCFLFDGDKLVGAGRALADGRDCSYLADIAIYPDYQGLGLGTKIVLNLIQQSQGHTKIILYANPGKEGFYSRLGFKHMNTAMAIFENEEEAIRKGTLEAE
jgi:ribosomal protein S18 acetylase RimI-like enzyme